MLEEKPPTLLTSMAGRYFSKSGLIRFGRTYFVLERGRRQPPLSSDEQISCNGCRAPDHSHDPDHFVLGRRNGWRCFSTRDRSAILLTGGRRGKIHRVSFADGVRLVIVRRRNEESALLCRYHRMRRAQHLNDGRSLTGIRGTHAGALHKPFDRIAAGGVERCLPSIHGHLNLLARLGEPDQAVAEDFRLRAAGESDSRRAILPHRDRVSAENRRASRQLRSPHCRTVTCGNVSQRLCATPKR